MIYFDHAATAMNRPASVLKAFEECLVNTPASPGRGSYRPAADAGRFLYECRCRIGSYFGLSEPDLVVFTKNSTEAVNLYLRGKLRAGDHVILSPYEHNCVFRTLYDMKLHDGITYTVIKREDLELSPKELLSKYCTDQTVLLCMMYRSNLTGRRILRKEYCTAAHERGLLVFCDASQGAGYHTIQMQEEGIDVLAFTGHKDLRGLPGVGGLCFLAEPKIKPLLQGGTGVFGYEPLNPKCFPDGLEAGTVNLPAIAALAEAVRVCEENASDNLKNLLLLQTHLHEKLKNVCGITIYDAECDHLGITAFNMREFFSDEVVECLDRAGICVRGGIHCTALAHEAIGTLEHGAVRIALSPSNTFEEIDALYECLKDMVH